MSQELEIISSSQDLSHHSGWGMEGKIVIQKGCLP